MMPTVIGLTGGVGSGKSLVCEHLRKLGAPVIDADQICHELLALDEVVKEEVRGAFGEGVFDSTGKIERHKLGKIVFSDTGRRKVLEEILHPRIGEELWKRAKRFIGETVVLEIPLLIETGAHQLVDIVVVVYATFAQQIKRLMERDGLSRKEALPYCQAQMPLEEKVSYAHYVINNTGPQEETQDQVRRFYQEVIVKRGTL